MKNKVKSAIAYFNYVRDIPYRIPLLPKESDYCCVGKHVILHDLLSSLGIKTRFIACEFLWSSLNLPKKVNKIPHDKKCNHTYLEFYDSKKRKWFPLDATWDCRLKPFFKISHWDGKNATPLAVKSIKKLSLRDGIRIAKETTKEEFIRDIKTGGKFYQAFNHWLEEIRNHN